MSLSLAGFLAYYDFEVLLQIQQLNGNNHTLAYNGVGLLVLLAIMLFVKFLTKVSQKSLLIFMAAIVYGVFTVFVIAHGEIAPKTLSSRIDECHTAVALRLAAVEKWQDATLQAVQPHIDNFTKHSNRGIAQETARLTCGRKCKELKQIQADGLQKIEQAKSMFKRAMTPLDEYRAAKLNSVKPTSSLHEAQLSVENAQRVVAAFEGIWRSVERDIFDARSALIAAADVGRIPPVPGVEPATTLPTPEWPERPEFQDDRRLHVSTAGLTSVTGAYEEMKQFGPLLVPWLLVFSLWVVEALALYFARRVSRRLLLNTRAIRSALVSAGIDSAVAVEARSVSVDDVLELLDKPKASTWPTVRYVWRDPGQDASAKDRDVYTIFQRLVTILSGPDLRVDADTRTALRDVVSVTNQEIKIEARDVVEVLRNRPVIESVGAWESKRLDSLRVPILIQRIREQLAKAAPKHKTRVRGERLAIEKRLNDAPFSSSDAVYRTLERTLENSDIIDLIVALRNWGLEPLEGESLAYLVMEDATSVTFWSRLTPLVLEPEIFDALASLSNESISPSLDDSARLDEAERRVARLEQQLIVDRRLGLRQSDSLAEIEAMWREIEGIPQEQHLNYPGAFIRTNVRLAKLYSHEGRGDQVDECLARLRDFLSRDASQSRSYSSDLVEAEIVAANSDGDRLDYPKAFERLDRLMPLAEAAGSTWLYIARSARARLEMVRGDPEAAIDPLRGVVENIELRERTQPMLHLAQALVMQSRPNKESRYQASCLIEDVRAAMEHSHVHVSDMESTRGYLAYTRCLAAYVKAIVSKRSRIDAMNKEYSAARAECTRETQANVWASTPAHVRERALHLQYTLDTFLDNTQGNAASDFYVELRTAVVTDIDNGTPTLMTCLRALMLRTNEWALAHRSSPRVAPIKADRRFLEVVESGGSVGQYLSDIMLPSRLATTSDLTEEALQIKKLMSRAMYLPRHLPRVLPGS